MEGVMMRSPHAWGIAIRKPSGEIITHSETLQRPSEKHKWMGWPFVRGLATLGQAMRLGFVASKFSLNVGLEEIAEKEGEKKPEISGWAMTRAWSLQSASSSSCTSSFLLAPRRA